MLNRSIAHRLLARPRPAPLAGAAAAAGSGGAVVFSG